VPRKSAAADGLSHRTREVGGRKRHCAGRDLPGHNLDGVPPGTDRRVLFFERARLLWVDIEDGQPAVHLVEQWAGCKEVTSFVEISDMRHVCVLQGCTRFLVKLWSIRAQKQQCDGEVIELHPRMLAFASHQTRSWAGVELSLGDPSLDAVGSPPRDST